MRSPLRIALLLLVAAACATPRPPRPTDTTPLRIGGRVVAVRDVGALDAGAPTVVLESGAGGGIDGWRSVQDSVAPAARVIAYERAGLGASSPAATPRSATQIARDLHDLLGRLGARPPYVLVGHSIAGFYVRAFTSLYPREVAGIVFVDPTTEEFLAWVAERAPDNAPPKYMARLASDTTAPAGVRAAAAAWPAIATELPSFALPAVPSRVVVGAARQRFADSTTLPAWVDAQRRFAARLRGAQVLVSDSAGHYVHVDEPALVVRAIREVLDDARARRPRRRAS